MEESLRKKARSQEQTIMDDIYDFIGGLDDKHLLAASRIIKVTIEDRQETRQEEEMLASMMSRTKIRDQTNSIGEQELKAPKRRIKKKQ